MHLVCVAESLCLIELTLKIKGKSLCPFSTPTSKGVLPSWSKLVKEKHSRTANPTYVRTVHATTTIGGNVQKGSKRRIVLHVDFGSGSIGREKKFSTAKQIGLFRAEQNAAEAPLQFCTSHLFNYGPLGFVTLYFGKQYMQHIPSMPSTSWTLSSSVICD